MATTPVLKTCIVSNFSGMLDVQTDGLKIRKQNNLKVKERSSHLVSLWTYWRKRRTARRQRRSRR